MKNTTEQNLQCVITTRDFTAEIRDNHSSDDIEIANTLKVLDSFIVNMLAQIVDENPTTCAEIVNCLIWEYHPKFVGDDMLATIEQFFDNNK